MNSFHKLRVAAEDILFPPLCILCRAHLTPRERELWRCERCTLPEDFPVGFFCPECKARSASIPMCHRAVGFSACAPWSYGTKNVRELVHMLKYEGVRSAAVSLGVPLARYVEKSLMIGGIKLTNTVCIPVPLYRTKLRKRGFNQSLLLARAMRIQAIPICEDALVRTVPVASQTRQEHYEMRTANVAGSFAVRNPDIICGNTILLIDDVITSGATMREAARVLRRVGAKRVIGIAAARA